MNRRFVRCALSAAALVASTAVLAPAQTADDVTQLKKEIEALKAGQAALQREIQQIKSFLSNQAAQRPAAPPAESVLRVGDGPTKGKKDAKVVLVEFTDYQ